MIILDGARTRSRITGLPDHRALGLFDSATWATFQEFPHSQRIHGCPYVINTYSSYVAYNLIDTNDVTAWVSSTQMSAGGVWCMLDIGSPKTIYKMRLYQSGGVDRATQYKLEACNDYNLGAGAHWHLAYTSAAGLAGGLNVAYLPGLKFRWWKWTALAGGNYGWNVDSIELFGAAI